MLKYEMPRRNAGHIFLIMLYKKRKPSWMFYIQFLLIIASIVFIFNSKGNNWRAAYEIEHRFPIFNELSMLQKIAMGFIFTSRYYIADEGGKYVFILLCTVLFAGVCIKNKVWWRCIISFSPLFLRIALNVIKLLWGRGMWTRGLRLLEVLWNNDSISKVSGYLQKYVWIQAIYYLFVWGCVFAGIYWINENYETAMLEWAILFIGLASRVMMGFSPTLYASGERTALFASVSCIIVAMRTVQKCLTIKKKDGL